MTAVLRRVRKAAVATVTGLAAVVAGGLLHGDVLVVAEAVIAAAGALGVYRVPNAGPK